MQSACAILSSVASSALLYFPQYLINGRIFEEKEVNEHEEYHLIFSTDWSQIFLILRRIEGDMISNIHGVFM
jgi:hypothetical protein